MDIAYCDKRQKQLGFLGFGASQKEANDKWNTVGLLIDEVKAAIANYPKAQAAVNAWPKLTPIEQQFYKDRQYVYDSTQGVTNWDKYIKQAEGYADQFRGLLRDIIMKSRELNESALAADYTPPTLKEPGVEDNTLLYVGVGVALVGIIGLSIYLNRPRQTAVAGLRRRRR